jgi:uncharacterized protein YigE (DUF2233 family)
MTWRVAVGCVIFGFCTMQSEAFASCRNLMVEKQSYTACEVDVQKELIGLFNVDANGAAFGSIAALDAALADDNKFLNFAMNAGMFDRDLKAIGYYVENGKMVKKLNRRGGAGNFHLKPNGVFFVKGKKSGVMETEAFAQSGIKPDLASQSGPMLVIDGNIHPKISATGTSRKIRNGVGMVDDHVLEFVISNSPVTFFEFASLFKDELKCDNALFLDGSISAIYSRELRRQDGFLPIGPIVGTFEIR